MRGLEHPGRNHDRKRRRGGPSGRAGWAGQQAQIKTLAEVSVEEIRASPPAAPSWTACWAAAWWMARWC
jgi:hypothetical protein